MNGIEKKEKQFEDDFRKYYDIDPCDVKATDVMKFIMSSRKAIREPYGLVWGEMETIIEKVLYYG